MLAPPLMHRSQQNKVPKGPGWPPDGAANVENLPALGVSMYNMKTEKSEPFGLPPGPGLERIAENERA